MTNQFPNDSMTKLVRRCRLSFVQSFVIRAWTLDIPFGAAAAICYLPLTMGLPKTGVRPYLCHENET
jgi:hypothetical protein